MNVVSLFDGMSCAQLALVKSGIKYDKYYACEVDKYAIKVSTDNFPETIHLGDVTKVDFKSLGNIDLLIGGSQCQGFSVAGKRLNFDDERSKLFFEYLRALQELKPKYFLLENVVMRKEIQDAISDCLGVKPVKINSSLLSAQNRPRLYWTNIPLLPIEDKGLRLRDVLEDNVDEKYILSQKILDCFIGVKNNSYNGKFKPLSLDDKSFCLTARYYKMAKTDPFIGLEFVGGLESGLRLNNGKYLSRNFRDGARIYSTSGKSASLTLNKGGHGGFTGL